MPNATAGPYSKGQLVRCSGSLVRVSDGGAIDPTTAYFAYRDPAGTWHTALTPVHDSLGNFHYDVDTSTPDSGQNVEQWWYVFYSPSADPEQAATQFFFLVQNAGHF